MADFTDTRTASERRVLAGLLALAALYVVALGCQFRDAVVDDAYIGLVFLRNLLAGQGFVFHAGSMPVEGISNIGWILALAPLLEDEPVLADIARESGRHTGRFHP